MTDHETPAATETGTPRDDGASVETPQDQTPGQTSTASEQTPQQASRETADEGDSGNRDRSRMPNWIPKLLGLIVLTAFGAVAAFLLLRKLHDLIFWIIAALFLSFALEPAVKALVRRGWRRGLATGLIIVGTLVVFAAMLALMVPLVVGQVRVLVGRAPRWLAEINVYTERWFHVRITGSAILDYIRSAKTDIAGYASTAAGVGAYIGSILFQSLTIALFTFYLVADGPRFRRTIASFLPQRRQVEFLRVIDVAIDKTGGYLYSRILLALLNGAFSYVALKILGVPFALPLSLWQGFVSQFIPVVGTYLGAAVPLLVAVLNDPSSALSYLIFVVVYQQIENYLLSPRITARTMELHPAVAFAAALAGASISGLLGAFLALPVAAVIQAIGSSYITRHDVVESDLTREERSEGPSEAPKRPGWFGRRPRWLRRPERPGGGKTGSD
jgi:predicted PurR-regulated permease PerM